jgi:Domain of unknown function (DUF1851)
MNLNDYLIPQSGKDWSLLLGGWGTLLPESFDLWLVNRFGDLFIVPPDESVHWLDVGGCTIQRVAESREHFATKLDEGDNANNWLMIHLVDTCVAAGVRPGPDQCYGYKIPPVLGGAYALGNVELTDLAVHYSLLADIHAQTKDLPDGTKVRRVVIS